MQCESCAHRWMASRLCKPHARNTHTHTHRVHSGSQSYWKSCWSARPLHLTLSRSSEAMASLIPWRPHVITSQPAVWVWKHTHTLGTHMDQWSRTLELLNYPVLFNSAYCYTWLKTKKKRQFWHMVKGNKIQMEDVWWHQVEHIGFNLLESQVNGGGRIRRVTPQGEHREAGEHHSNTGQWE